MAQVDLLTNYQNQNSLYNNVNAERTIGFNKKIPSDKSKGDNFQCTYLRSQSFQDSPKNGNSIDDNQTPSDCSYDSGESDSYSSSYVLRWLKSLPSSFIVDDREENMNRCKLNEKPDSNRCKLKEKSPDSYRCALAKAAEKKSKSLGSSLQSITEVPLEGKRRMLTGRNQRVDFTDGLDSAGMSCPLRRKGANRSCPSPSASRLAKKYGKSDLRPIDTRSQQNLINYNQWRRVGVSKNASTKSILSAKQSQTMQRKIASNRRLLSSIKEIISTVDGDDRCSRLELNKRNIRKGNAKIAPISCNAVENSIRKPIFKNPDIERSLNDSMKSTLKRYIHSSTWDNFKENKTGEPPVKKGKRVLPSLAPSDSLDIEPDWNTHPVFSTLRTF